MATSRHRKSVWGATASRLKQIVRPVDRLVFEACPLHTEKPEWAVHAPAQVDAACKRGAHAIAFTECRDDKIALQLAAVCEKNGYHFFNDQGDTAIAYKASLTNAHAGNGKSIGFRVPSFVKFTFRRRTVTFFALHWDTNKPGNQANRDVQTQILIEDMSASSSGANIAFYAGDSNPTKPLRDQTGDPQAALAKAGLPLIYSELNYFPVGVGVTAIGRNVKDTAVSAVSVELNDSLGSDHHPAIATYAVKRRRLLSS